LPQFLARRPGSRATERTGATVRDYLIGWLCDWVRRFGIDGFRCDSAKHVELDAWFELKQSAVAALADWRAATGQPAGEPFWMMGEVFGHGVAPGHYCEFGFDSVLNFDFQHQLTNRCALSDVYAEYAAALSGAPAKAVSYLSSHDTDLFDRDRLIEAATALMLAPGGVLLFYGDETARPSGPCPSADPLQATRSNMNWETVDQQVLTHWQRLGQFRSRHVALARGTHRSLNEGPYTFARLDAESGDRIIAVPCAQGKLSVRVEDIFAEGALLHDAYTGWRGRVRDGHVVVPAQGTVLLEQSIYE
jgi:alpha-amylase